MDERVAQALRLLREAGRLDLLVAGADGGVGGRPALRAASQVVAAVVACSPPCSPKKKERQGGRWFAALFVYSETKSNRNTLKEQ
ncbi:hypothetical protein NDU88_003874 [Pleurodeles waltl]|uniref:Uncharacterized protein n=1 Tax=Pleurodeles waltl TaxID=8319 RepID=A0AAV7QAM4_PLEWA|nr:hypothetical protein NDU88_003874 [Pleurodeles waltl]